MEFLKIEIFFKVKTKYRSLFERKNDPLSNILIDNLLKNFKHFDKCYSISSPSSCYPFPIHHLSGDMLPRTQTPYCAGEKSEDMNRCWVVGESDGPVKY